MTSAQDPASLRPPPTPSPWRRALEKTGAASLDFLLPPLCLACEAPVNGPHALCARCWKAIPFIAPPCCACCGLPFDVPVDDATLCGECLAFPPAFTRARSVFLYDEASRGLLLGFKHADRLHAAPALAAWLRRVGEPFWPTTDLIVPVPLHWWRLFRRRYNQAALLAQALGRATGVRVGVDVLLRCRATDSQGHKGRRERERNVAGAFVPHPRRRALVEGKRIVLVDDVLTTGATVNACARALREAGARDVRVLTVARTRSLDM